ncbi:endonuclease domain-containing protein [Hyphomicrobium sp. DY-1]|uniref:endonuclease domain-containing protein n=1 Tax=Hyphomicrobium sp. DY-1 TaxID=3075650 RepID=UPI0039C302D1
MDRKSYEHLVSHAKKDLIGCLFERVAIESAGCLSNGVPCEYDSPIEEILAAALEAYIHVTRSHIVFFGTMFETLDVVRAKEFPARSNAFIQPQVSILQYRVDFLAVTQSADGGRRFIAIECDGHDFHEKTRDQAQRDKLRDREIQNAGVEVHRFTGSEIWNKPFEVAYEIVERINDQLSDVLYTKWMESLRPRENEGA